MRAKQNGRAAVLQLHDAVERLARKGAVAYRQRLVDDQDVGLDAGGNGKREAHVHAARIGFDRLLDEGRDARKVDDRVVALVDFGCFQAQHRRVQIDVFTPGELGIETGTQFQQGGHPAPHRHRARGWRQGAAHRLQQGRLAGAVAPDQAQYLAARQLEADVVQSDEFAVVFGRAALPHHLLEAIDRAFVQVMHFAQRTH